MAEKKHSIRMITGWTGKVDGKERHVKAGEVVAVDAATCQALVYTHLKAELVPDEEIIAKAKVKKDPAKNRASRTRAKKKPPQDKMVRDSTQKQGD